MLFFVDESGIDEKGAPYVVRGGISISEADLWKFENAVKSLQREIFGLELIDIGIEIKGKRLLKRKTFRHASQGPPITDLSIRRLLANSFLTKGFEEKNGRPFSPRITDEYTAYGQSAIDFVGRLLDTAVEHGVKTFAAITPRNCPVPADPRFLRKDFNYLFERFYLSLENMDDRERGLLICDELEANQSRELIAQTAGYFQETFKGRQRSTRMVPVPFFVKSHLTTAIQLADLVCYVINWAVRLGGMTAPVREELVGMGEKVFEMKFRQTRVREPGGEAWVDYGLFYLTDLRGAADRA